MTWRRTDQQRESLILYGHCGGKALRTAHPRRAWCVIILLLVRSAHHLSTITAIKKTEHVMKRFMCMSTATNPEPWTITTNYFGRMVWPIFLQSTYVAKTFIIGPSVFVAHNYILAIGRNVSGHAWVDGIIPPGVFRGKFVCRPPGSEEKIKCTVAVHFQRVSRS